MLDPKLGLTLRTRTAISMLVTACAVGILLNGGVPDDAPPPRRSAPFDPLRAPPSVHAEERVAYIAEGGLDGSQTRLTARATERVGGSSRDRKRPAGSSSG